MSIVTLASGQTFSAEAGISLLDAAAAQGFLLEHSCSTGRCGTCKARVRSGRASAVREATSLTAAEAADGWVLTCSHQADTDLTLEIADLSAYAIPAAKTLPCRINAIDPLAPDVLRVELRLPPASGFSFLAGQYIDISGPGGIKRSYSIASEPRHPDRLELHVQRVDGGAMSRYWFESAKPNDLLRFRGPLGTFFLRDLSGMRLIFLATGTGYSPIQSMLSQLQIMAPADQPDSVALLWGGRESRDLYLDPGQAGNNALQFTPVLSRPGTEWQGARGHVHRVLLDQQPDLVRSVIYACGSDAMIQSAKAALIAAGLRPDRFHADAFVRSE